MTKYTYLTNDELIRTLSVDDTLTELEHELLDRLIRVTDALLDLEGGMNDDT